MKYHSFVISAVQKRYKHTGKVIAIRREDQSVWERRAALAPSNVRQLTRAGVKVIVQPSNRRAYPVQNIRLIDYEKLVDESGHRVVAFGKYAGVAGMVNIIHGLGLRLLALGHHTPFMHVGPAHNYRNSSMARQAIRDAGYEIALGMMPKSIGPITFVFTGSGNVSQGGQEVFQELPHEYVPPEMLQKVANHGVTTKIYGCEVRRRHHLERKEGGGYDPVEYKEDPSKYISTFSKKIAPYTSVLINGIYWAVGSPKLLTLPDAKTLLRPMQTPWLPTSEGAPPLPHRMLGICDISADPGGSIEFMNECTTINTPFCLYDADRNKDTKSFKGPGVLVCSIDNMPTQLPRESTDFFGDLVLPYAFDILQSDATKPLEDHNFIDSVHGAIIASNGKLTPDFQYIQELRNQRGRHKLNFSMDSDAEQLKQILVLGAGHVCPPLVEYLHREENVQIKIGSWLREEMDMFAENYPRVEAVLVDVIKRPEHLMTLVETADLVVSLLPYQLHHLVAECCIKTKTNMVTASYCTPEMMKLHNKAVEAGVTIVNEIGLDPGIDHLLAMECIDEVHQAGGKIESFISYCGGLPAPEFSDNPLRYKFSWNPRGVLLNTLGQAKFLFDSQSIEIPAGGELMKSARNLDFLPGFALEGFPNRDSTRYAQLYGIAAEAHTVFRGTLRFSGYAKTIQALQKLGLVDPNPHPCLHPKGPEITWRELVCSLLGLSDSDIFYENLKGKVSAHIGEEHLPSIENLGLLDEIPVQKLDSPLDTISHYLSQRLAFGKNERDIVILHHDIGIVWPNDRKEKRGITLVEYGDTNNITAMARTVGLPAAIAAKMVLDGEIQEHGMVLPFTPDMYRPILSRLRAEGIVSSETVKSL
ncbi:lysine ketoglutarate reductase/saccharopine dehydrogenase isoform X2 [Lycorma delicatula]|uniref:lysine ketoglutarate reductase/saccharopine dehydrogenase isoform X2 n=1 Tax=Lycorma delicatula TaxID=130591 RepID=UPI003F50EAA3